MSLQPAASCTSEVAARTILEWVSSLSIPEFFVSDGAPHFFKNETLKLVAAKMGASYRFLVAHSSWSKGTVEQMNERGHPPSEWLSE